MNEEILTLKNEPRKIRVDVYAWLQAIEKAGSYTMEGVFRNAFHLGKLFVPSYTLLPYEKDFSSEVLEVLEKELGKPIEKISFTAIAGKKETVARINAVTRAWISLAVDFPSPMLAWRGLQFPRIAILNDVLASEGSFGEGKKETFVFGAKNNDVFLPISKYSRDRFISIFDPQCEKTYLPFGCPHSSGVYVSDLLKHTLTVSGTACAVHSVYPRKRLALEYSFCHRYGFSLRHIGRDFPVAYLWGNESGSSSRHPDRELLTAPPADFKHYGPLPENEMLKLVGECEMFVCMSTDEGFSIPPMEAALLGVPIICVSDIPIHREIYGKYLSVNLISPQSKSWTWEETRLTRMTMNDRLGMFENYQSYNVYRDLHRFLSTLPG